ncbi:LytR/AlgR family response regulator transcription factor [Flavobacterium capsici]|uniref:Response regulator transcription factor n=1 Tax=Flavobacterium capsici TaxID=3075618 RepID=A0AA96J5Z1_9FLAO|nr:MULTISPECIES: response regulator transcription factor [unclassified Flavobacterium]WNM19561.1 response regulator transcription factor [Flavobacterium sp. PMR2A8]WNM20950.1 response regulator transcription factor [Flavobacterium sp. PMTSA4]
MKHSYIIVDDSHESILNTQATAMRFQNLAFAGYASNYDSALNLILEHQPSLIFLEINPLKKESNLSLSLINELYRYLTIVPKIIVTSKDQSLVFRAMEYGVSDYLVKPLDINAFRKAIFKFEKSIVQNTLPNTIVQQQPVVPQQAFTFSDFLRQEPIQKPIVQEEVEPTIEEELEPVVTEKESIDENIASEITVVEPTHETTATEDTLEENVSETAIEEETTEIESVETSEEDLEKVEEENIEEITEETSEDELDEASNDEESITILPGQKVVVEQEQPLVICVKSYGDYRYIDSRDILYFEADNNSTDIHLKDGEMVTAFKTLKVFENVLPQSQFLRIHNSYIINVNQVARIHTGNTVCYIKNSTIKLPFSKSYKENVELIIHRIASGNYLEI